MDLWGWCIEEADGSLEGNFPELVEDAGLCEIIDLTRCCVFPGCWACKGLEINGFEIEAVVSAVSKVVGKSMSLWIWIPSPGPICEIWLKLEGAEIILERRSGFLKRIFKIIFFSLTPQKILKKLKPLKICLFLIHSCLRFDVWDIFVWFCISVYYTKANSKYKIK